MHLPPAQAEANTKFLSGGGFGSLSERLSKMRHDVNNRLGVLSAATQIMQMKPDPQTAAQRLPTIAAQPQTIKALVEEFSAHFEKQAALIDQISMVLPRLTPNSPEYQSAQAILTSQRPAIDALEQELGPARRAAMEAVLDHEFDEATLRRLTLRVAEIEIELTVLRARALAGITPPLKDTQKQQLLKMNPR
jgi:DNA repair ATPase RecN